MKKNIKNTFIIILLIIVDQLIKMAILNTLAKTGNTISMLNIISLTYLENKGVAFGLFNSNIIIIFVDILIIIAIIKILLNKKYKITNFVKIACFLIIAGGVGNLIDRVFRGYVIDYFDITKLLEFPVFNLADIYIVIGVVMLIATIIITTIKSQENANGKV